MSLCDYCGATEPERHEDYCNEAKAVCQRDMAIRMLAEWCVDIVDVGSGWDDWGENYNDAMYRPGPLRLLLDQAIKEVRRDRKVRGNCDVG